MLLEPWAENLWREKYVIVIQGWDGLHVVYRSDDCVKILVPNRILIKSKQYPQRNLRTNVRGSAPANGAIVFVTKILSFT